MMQIGNVLLVAWMMMIFPGLVNGQTYDWIEHSEFTITDEGCAERYAQVHRCSYRMQNQIPEVNDVRYRVYFNIPFEAEPYFGNFVLSPAHKSEPYSGAWGYDESKGKYYVEQNTGTQTAVTWTVNLRFPGYLFDGSLITVDEVFFTTPLYHPDWICRPFNWGIM
jgi:hypothetical protein